jgi:hypothetical protein
VLLSNIYAAGGEWDLSANVNKRLESTVGKQLGRTWIEVNNGGNRFVGDGQHHPQILQNCPVEEILHADG